MLEIGRTARKLATVVRGGNASGPGERAARRPTADLVLYEFEGCPMCRRVREALTDLDLTAQIRPCPKGGTRFRPEAEETSGRMQFPLLVDESAGVTLLESDAIVRHLYSTYGLREVPSWLTGPGFAATSQLASMLGGGAGFRARPSLMREGRVELRCFESDPDARRVRELLCELEVPYVRVPGTLRLRDPDSGEEACDVEAILAWLEQRYGA